MRTEKARKNIIGYIFSSPFLIFTLVMWLYPFIWGLIISFKKWNLISPSQPWVGLQNYIKVIKDPMLWIMIRNSVYFMLVFISLTTATSLLVALLIKQIPRFKGLFITGFLLAYVSSGVAYSMVFNLLFSGDGMINNFLANFNIKIGWFTNPKIAMASIGLIVCWKFTGYYALFFLSGLNNISESLYEAAKIDGANAWQRFIKITVPMLNPTFVMITVFATITSFNLFTEPFMITGGGPMDATRTMMLEIYNRVFSLLQAGYGSTLAIVSGIITFIFVWVLRQIIERDDIYE
ncbi:carbohydrate ABC transporter membrane protein 1 (CUT1 family) [Halanaerobium saccharolyticum]|uniref:Carbohydrate ABC transporter membrane protein 1 (CUT1 family) n=1 Tax=Halanaerobium saccharolyticum TaxID=43595 RepID=A0A4R7YSP6_9FIRM|nr:sugar ABC transporter permease [Halanaerobium saccharolyticum]RAK06319.1 carbohydrate ABC transporter membrane protein 1 (CUT1 family) [Halanaerobium saccharolyticum]TDW00798.1 carbohydrate ABC transporter membrane protein 1 (CUT1 family) [Halanaerobium saccharolyticum]TDX52440.1 carbohydrate ABC transporter membrane protein 1 (CUT1 family) [Halanaerobium saccharolyticum]